MKVVELKDSPAVEVLIEVFGRRRLPFILDSAQSNDGLGEWSFFGAEPFQVIQGSLDDLRDAMAPHDFAQHAVIPFTGGSVGFLSYDYGRRIECLPDLAIEDRDVPELHFGLYDGIAALNHKTGVLYLVALGVRAPEDSVLAEIKSWLEIEDTARAGGTFERGEWEWNLSVDEFCAAVNRVRELIATGDVYQINLSRRARCAFQGDALALYQALRKGNPAPYGAFLDTGALQLMSTSPEQFLLKRGNELVTRPIKGTRPRGADAKEDAILTESLRFSEKDRAELLMIVDLERNDLGRVAEFGTVQVENLYQLEHYARVIHQTAQVKARLAEGLDVFDALRALFPGGSITGAPKVRAMEIIEALEPTRRGAYCGSIGYIGFDGNAEFNIAIRSLHLQGGFLDYQVGGGIVWDSIAENEYQETLDKGRAIRETIDALCQRL